MGEDPFKNKPFKTQTPENLNQDKNEELDIKIEFATPEDWELIRDLRLEAIDKYPELFGATSESIKKEKEKSEEDWKKGLDSEDEFYMLSRSGPKAIGMIRAWERIKEKKIWHMGQAYIKDEFQRKGIGKKLYKEPLSEIVKRNGAKVTALIKKDNGKSLHLVESLGFKKVPILTSSEYTVATKKYALIKGFLAVELDLTKNKDSI